MKTGMSSVSLTDGTGMGEDEMSIENARRIGSPGIFMSSRIMLRYRIGISEAKILICSL